MGNFIKLNRKILKWEWWHDIKTYRLFSYMLLAAWWKNGNYKGEPIPRGSFPSSISDLSKETDLSDNEVRTALKHLKSTGEITSKSHSKFTVFTVKNYELYQGDNEQLNEEITSNLTNSFTSKNTNSSQGINKDLTSKSQADNEQITGSNNSILNNIDTIKENKEDNNINNIQEEKKIEEDKKKRSEEEKDIHKAERERIINYFNLRCNTNYRPNSKDTKEKVNARLAEGFTEEDFYLVIDKKANEWIGTEYEKFLTPETLFRPSKFEKYLNQNIVKPQRQTATKAQQKLEESRDMMRRWAEQED